MKLNVKAFALTTGIFWGFAILFITWWIILLDGQTGEELLIVRVYIGYNVSAIGSLIGFIWGLVDGILGGAVFAWIYNYFTDKFA